MDVPTERRWKVLGPSQLSVLSPSRVLRYRPGPKVVGSLLILTSLFVLLVLPVRPGPVEVSPQGGTRSLRNPGGPLRAITDESNLSEDGAAAEVIEDEPSLSVDPLTFLTAYEDSVPLDNVQSMCTAPPPPNSIYVAPGGNDDGPGTEAKPLATISVAMRQAQAGQTVLVRGGEYRESVRIAEKYGTPDAYITLRSYPQERAKILTEYGQDAIYFRRGNAYINIACLEMEGPSARPDAGPSSPDEFRNRIRNGQSGVEQTPRNYGSGVDIGDRADTRAGLPLNHHIRVVANDIHDFAEAGIAGVEVNHITIVGNRTHRNSKYGCHSGSGITLAYLLDGGGPDNSDGYSNYIVGNVSYENENLSLQCFSENIGAVLTDGNGIIIDQNDLSGQYFSRTLVADNVVYDNGGRGIMVFESSRVDVVNNVSYNNVLTENLVGREGPHPEIAVSGAEDVRIYNNIALPRPGHVAYSSSKANVDERTNIFAEPGEAGQYYDTSMLEIERRFELQDSAITQLAGGTPYLAAPRDDDGRPVLMDPVIIGPVFNQG